MLAEQVATGKLMLSHQNLKDVIFPFEGFKKGDYFFYVSCSNEIYECDFSSFEELERNDYAFIENHKPSFFNYGFENINFDFPKEVDFKDKYERKLSHFIIELTWNCNLHCSYCIYTDVYSGTRNREPKHFKRHNIEPTVDFILRHSESVDEINIGFYGGEPLSRLKTLISFVEEIEKRVNKKINYTVTTNATLLNDYCIDYLINKKFQIDISLDGPSLIHDKYRRTIKNQATFEIVYSALKKIRSKNPDYFKNKVKIFSTIVTAEDFLTSTDFFSKDDVLKDIHVQPGFINTLDKNSFKMYKFNTEIWNKILLNYCNEGRGHPLDTIYSKILALLDIKPIQRAQWPHSACFPGYQRTFIDIFGDVHICERVNHSNPIGDIFQGFNYDLLKQLMNEYVNLTNEYCKTCWANRLCFQCFQHLFTDELGFNTEKFFNSCKLIKSTIINVLKIKSHRIKYLEVY